MEAAAGGMSGGKRNHEDLSDMMALVEAACKVPAIRARPRTVRIYRRDLGSHQPVASAVRSLVSD